jgi:translation initiation factor 1
MSKRDSRIVWSSDQGDVRKAAKQVRTGPGVISLSPAQQTVYLHRDSKGRHGGTVTVLRKLVLSDDDLKDLAKKLKQLCGSGGTVKGGEIEIQGEHRERIAEALRKMGYKVKIAGG